MGIANYSAGQNTTDHKTASNCTISSDILIFTVAQNSDYMVIGDRITYDTTKVAYLYEKVSSTVWWVVAADGGSVSDESTPVTVNSIAHEYDSLSDAEAGASDSDHLDTLDLVTATTQLWLTCCYDSGPDTTNVNVDAGWTGSSSYYIYIFAPKDTKVECNVSQRHAGKWDSAKYSLEYDAVGSRPLKMDDDYVKVEGLQIKTKNATTSDHACISVGAEHIWISQCIVTADNPSTTASISYGISAGYNRYVYIWNNLIYDIDDGSNSAYGIQFYGSSVGAANQFAFNNTIVNCDKNCHAFLSANRPIYKNNISIDGSVDYNASIDQTYSTNNLDSDGTATGVNPINNKTLTFADKSGKDFRLAAGDTDARDAGVDLSSDSDIPFDDDIIGTTRSAWDVGAFEYIAVEAVANLVGKLINNRARLKSLVGGFLT